MIVETGTNSLFLTVLQHPVCKNVLRALPSEVLHDEHASMIWDPYLELLCLLWPASVVVIACYCMLMHSGEAKKKAPAKPKKPTVKKPAAKPKPPAGQQHTPNSRCS